MSSFIGKPTRRDIIRLGAAGAAVGAIGMPYIAHAQALDPVRFSLEFRIYGGNAPLFLGVESGIFKNLGLDVSLDGSAGSGESVTRVAGGTHDFGLADVSTLVEFASRNPQVSPKLIMTVFDQFPACVLSLSRKPVKTLQDLPKIKLGTGTSDAGAKILPALLALNNIDPKTLNRLTIDVKLRDTMLMKGEVDAVIAFDYTAIFNLIDNGLKLEDINLLYYSKFGFDFWGNSLIASKAMIEKNPDLVRRVALGVARSWVAGAKNRQAAIDAVTKREKLLNPKTERARMDWVIDKHILTEKVKAGGLGQMDDARMEKGIALLKDGFQLSTSPRPEDIYDGRFLPAAEERKIG